MSANGSGPIERYFRIVETLAASQNGLTLTDISQLTDLPKPTAHRLVRSLVELGILISDDAWNKTFRVGPRMWRMLHLGLNQDKAGAYAQLVVDDLAALFCETTYVVRLNHEHVLSIARSAPDQGHRLHVLPGEHLPAHAAASAKAILAYQEPEVVRQHLHEPLENFTPYTNTDLGAVLTEFEEIRRTGYALCFREIDENIMAYACPVHMKPVGVLYAIGVTGPVTRLQKHPVEHWINPMKTSARRLAAMLTTLERD